MTWLTLLRRNAPGVVVLLAALTLAGVLGATRLPAGLYPEVTFPRIVVAATLNGASAQTLRLSVTGPVEEALSTVIGVRQVRSRTIRAAAEISLWFDSNADMERALGLVNARLAEVQNALPADATLSAERLTPSSFPIQTLAVTGTVDPALLREFALRTLRPGLAGLAGVGRVDVVGGDVRELGIAVDAQRLEQAKLDLPTLATQVGSALVLEPAGRVDVHYQQALVVVRGPVDSPDRLAALVVGGTPEAPVQLGDVARIQEGHADRLSLTYANGRPAVLVNVGRRPGADAVTLARDIQAELDRVRAGLPPGIDVELSYDQAGLIARSVAHVREEVILGGLLTLAVVGLFLRSWRAMTAAAVVLPATLAMTFGALWLVGGTLNLMSLGGLAVAIGLVVDDAVVVVEAVYRRVAAGTERWAATADALREIAWPVTNSTLTTVVVFAPLSLLPGVSGQFFTALAFTLCTAVLFSLVLAVTLTPLLCGWLLVPPGGHPAPEPVIPGFMLTQWRARPGVLVAGVVLLTVLLALLGRGVGTGFLPELDEGAFVVDYFTPTGTSVAEADRLGRALEAVVADIPEVMGTSRRLGAELGPPAATESSRGDLTVSLSPRRTRHGQDIIEATRTRAEAALPGVRLEFVELLQDVLSDLEGAPDPVEVKLLGQDVQVLRDFAPRVAERLRDIPGLADLFDGVTGCIPETHLDVDLVQAGRLGFTTREVSAQVRTALLGDVVGTLPREGRQVDVRVRLREADRMDPQVLQRLRLRTASGQMVPLTQVARVRQECQPAELLSDNLRPLVAVTGRLEGRDLGSVTAEVEARLATLEKPAGVEVRLGGQRESQRESFQALVLVLALATLGVFLVLTFHFRGVVLPLLILGSVPVALAAGVACLRLTGTPLNVSSLMGCILLVGLVVKNGILLLDRAEEGRAEGMAAAEAVGHATSVRLRPILMTTLATLLGLVPLALGLGEGGELQRPLAITVLGGLSLSTLTVLVGLPAAYVLVRRHTASAKR
ncbi:efflux RND transporter permease subunit [Corallococcus sp. AB030]|uniref:efflux RND transporter permease subunit n=1 Tax=Corallococcus TaxID=83461 RepID=UPI000EE06CEF|nr:efflux RND transporter permease subunit [Corallococcus sp. AB030]NRD55347.1 efflux RND transporter permease subunit [Corallococcus exiguus]RKI06730.1 efflux RND transporter permease subunit [Corallococcus sp. AB030]